MKETKLDKIQMTYLADIYGSLLTDKQRKMLSLFYAGDCSLGEIAEQVGITRQAVHDSIAKAETILLNAEQKMHVLEKMRKINAEAHKLLDNCDDNARLSDALKNIINLTEV